MGEHEPLKQKHQGFAHPEQFGTLVPSDIVQYH